MIYVVRLNDEKRAREGIRLGTVRRPPRGVPKASQLEYYDVWLPELAPSDELAKWSRAHPSRSWADFERRYIREMKRPTPSRLIGLLAALSRDRNLSVGCYCDDYDNCHRSALYRLLEEAGASLSILDDDDDDDDDEWVDD